MTCLAPGIIYTKHQAPESGLHPDEYGFILDHVAALLVLNGTPFTYYPNPTFETLGNSGIMEVKPGSPIILKVSRFLVWFHFLLLLSVERKEDKALEKQERSCETEPVQRQLPFPTRLCTKSLSWGWNYKSGLIILWRHIHFIVCVLLSDKGDYCPTECFFWKRTTCFFWKQGKNLIPPAPGNTRLNYSVMIGETPCLLTVSESQLLCDSPDLTGEQRVVVRPDVPPTVYRSLCILCQQ